MSDDPGKERFIQSLTNMQCALFAYLVALIGNVDEANNVLQETNLVLWRRSDDFAEGTDFKAWARKIAHLQTLAFFRDRKRDRLLFDPTLLTQIAERPQPEADDDARRLALRHCLAALPDNLRLLLSQRYAGGSSIRDLAGRLGKTETAVKVALSRVRQKLLVCVEKTIVAEGA